MRIGKGTDVATGRAWRLPPVWSYRIFFQGSVCADDGEMVSDPLHRHPGRSDASRRRASVPSRILGKDGAGEAAICLTGSRTASAGGRGFRDDGWISSAALSSVGEGLRSSASSVASRLLARV